MEFEKEVNPTSVADKLRTALSTRHPQKFLNELLQRYRRSIDINDITLVCQSIEPYDKAMGPDYEALTANVFLHGTNIGKYVSESLHPEVGFKRLLSIEIKNMVKQAGDIVGIISDDYARKQAFAEIMLGFGWEGCNQFPDLTSIVESAEDRITGDSARSHFMRPGMGFVLNAMNKAATKQDLETMEQELALLSSGENFMDWDAELKGWSGENDQ
ncbi:MAG TPA: hypothetical protein PLZ58_03715 [Candidatus Saccharibacteria bacterium]|nr:hypothetical protein [Candidatus Saccharibacteria bacterium]HRQ06818.1 hypothetical protein [Candidatus Saccharibacteria bacterium]